MARVSVAFDSLITDEQVVMDLELAGFTDISGPNAKIFEGEVKDPDAARSVLKRLEAWHHVKDYLVI